MRTTDALRQLTRNERDEADDDEYDEWLIIKVPTRQRLKYLIPYSCFVLLGFISGIQLAI